MANQNKNSESLSLFGSTGSATPVCNNQSLLGSSGSLTPVSAQFKGLMLGSRKMVSRVICRTNFFIVDINKACVYNVSKTVFSKSSGKFYQYSKSISIKLVGCDINNFKALNKKLNFSGIFVAETFSRIKDFISGINHICSSIANLGSLVTFASTIKREITQFAFSFFSLFMKINTFITKGCDVSGIIDFCIEVYRCCCVSNEIKQAWQAEVIFTSTLAAASMFLPKELIEILRRISLLSNVKIFDDLSGLFSIYSLILEFFQSICNYLPFKCPDIIRKCFSYIPDLDSYHLIYKMKQIYTKWKIDNKLMLSDSFRCEVKAIHTQCNNNDHLIDWSKRSKSVQCVINDYFKLFKSCKSYEESARVEPACFIFEGPPGTMKSVYMNKLIRAMNCSSYSHIIKSIMDGKDFYDAYNNEKIFFMDDVGQQGLSQWRFLINMISPVKLPLDCASAELKDTKYFSSPLVFLTTNRFQNLQGLTKTDGIDNLEALWRRAYVFSFDKTYRQGRELRGVVQFKFFDQKIGWQCGFPKDFIGKLLDTGCTVLPNFHLGESSIEFLAWMKTIIKIAEELKEDQFEDNDLSEEEKIFVDKACEQYFDVETFYDVRSIVGEKLTFLKDCLYETMVSSNDVIKEQVSKLVVHINDEKIFYGGLLTLGLPILAYGIWSVVTAPPTGSVNFIPETALNKIKEMNTSVDRLHPSVNLIQRQMFDAMFIDVDDGSGFIGVVLISGKRILTTSHNCLKDKAFLVVYKDSVANHRLIDNIRVDLVWRDNVSDCAIWKLPDNYPTPFKDLSHLFSDNDTSCPMLINPHGVIPLSSIISKGVEFPIPYKLITTNTEFVNYLNPHDFAYNLNYGGMCGSIIASQQGNFLGIHVAGCDEYKIGVSLRLPRSIICKIGDLLRDTGIKVDVNLSNKIIPEFSGIKLDKNLNIFTPKNTNYVPSPLFGVFETTRQPADLNITGPHTIKDVAKKSFIPLESVPNNELEFGRQVLDLLIEPFNDLPIDEVIAGNELLAGINKKSSNGYNCPKKKSECINYEDKCLTLDFQKDYNLFLDNIQNDNISVEDIIWCETLKDELRPDEKLTPRSFRVSRLHTQLLTKTIFGNMVAHIVKNRKYNNIMIGVNPYKEWRSIFDRVNPFPKWAGDIGKYDGKMLAQVMQVITEVLRSKYLGNVKNFNAMMAGLTNSFVAINDDVFMTTHSMPSGSFLTALFNSLVNRFYTAMWYYRNLKNYVVPCPIQFSLDIIDMVYGDDKLNALLNKKWKEQLNALTMRDFFQSIGMTFTDSVKNPVVFAFQPWEDITFLKRNFTYHSEIGDVVGPLDTRTLFSSMSWVDKKKDVDQVLQDKIHAFQRELYLHCDLYDFNINLLERACAENHISCNILSKTYLLQLYKTGEYTYFEELYGLKTLN